MKGTKVLTLGAGHEVLPHNMHGGYKDVRCALAIRMRGTVNWWAGWSILPFVVSYIPAC